MSEPESDFETVLFKIVEDAEFRETLEKKDRRKVLSGFRLTTSQIAMIVALNIAAFLALAGPVAAVKPI